MVEAERPGGGRGAGATRAGGGRLVATDFVAWGLREFDLRPSAGRMTGVAETRRRRAPRSRWP